MGTGEQHSDPSSHNAPEHTISYNPSWNPPRASYIFPWESHRGCYSGFHIGFYKGIGPTGVLNGVPHRVLLGDMSHRVSYWGSHSAQGPWRIGKVVKVVPFNIAARLPPPTHNTHPAIPFGPFDLPIRRHRHRLSRISFTLSGLLALC
jgi:hypothetical protein